MITLEQIRLLESRITRALDLIRVLKEENSTLRKGLESAQKRMRELETLVDGFKTDQKEIESIIVRTLHNLDNLEETAATAGVIPAGASAPRRGEPRSAAVQAGEAVAGPVTAEKGASPAGESTAPPSSSPKEELDIF